MGDSGSLFDNDLSQGSQSLIAVVGIGLRLPGGVNSTSSLWDLLINKRDGRCEVPSSRYNVDAFHKGIKTTGSVASRHGYFLQDNVATFDASFFSMSKAEVERLDPQQRMLLEVVWECMENGGQRNWRGDQIGCYVGAFGDDWLDLGAKDPQNSGLYRISGSESLGLSNRISYEFDLKGPSMTIRTGCSASLVALHEACQAVKNGDCKSAIVAGCNLILTPTMTIAMTEQGVLSPDGISKSFDAGANGYGRGEGINAVFIKPLVDALRDGDSIRAVIRATATNCDGKTAGISMPNPEAHETMIRRAYEIAGISDYSQTALVECHATGTSVGDPLEAKAVANVFASEKGVYIGSIKPNVGHGEGASGLSSLIKAILALEKRTIPPNIHFKTPNPKIPFAEANLRVPIEATPWPANQAERVSVNSFGIGGANAHVIIESAAFHGVESRLERTSSRPQLLLYSANDAKSLQSTVESYQQHLEFYPGSIAAVSSTLVLRRDHLPYRAFSIKSDKDSVPVSSMSRAKNTPAMVFVFTGQGAQWAQMGIDLMERFPSFKQDFRDMQATLSDLPHPPTWNLLDELMKPASESLVAKSEYAQPLCTAIQVALVNILKLWKTTPTAVVGHSSGEIAAAYASGAITLSEAITIAYYRGRGTVDVTTNGGMAAVGLSKEYLTPFLEDGVVVACDNSPQSVTLSGDAPTLKKVMATVREANPDAFVRPLKVEMAYHSHHMRGIGKAYESSLDSRVTARAPDVPFYSTVSGKLEMLHGALGPAYWRKNLESPVLFNQAVSNYLETCQGDTLFVEIGPHTTLGGPLRQIFKASKCKADLSYVSCLERGKNCSISMLTLAGSLFQKHISLEWSALIPSLPLVTDLPIYSWSHDAEYWSETRAVREWRTRKFSHHELLGSRIVEGNEFEPTWRNRVSLGDSQWIRDHRIQDDIVFPAAGYISMVGEACRQISNIDDYTIRNLIIKTALVMREEGDVEIMTTLRPSQLTDTLESSWYEFTISSYNGVWMKHCSGQVKAGGGNYKNSAIVQFPRAVHMPYNALSSVGLNYGPYFQGMVEVSAKPGFNMAAATISAPSTEIQDSYQLHPTSIDCCLQLFMVAMSEGVGRRFDRLFVPTEIGELYIGKVSPRSTFRAQATTLLQSSSFVTGNAFVTAQDGMVVLSLSDGKFTAIEERAEEKDNIAAAEIFWKPDIDLVQASDLIRPRGEDGMRGSWLSVEQLCLLCMVEMSGQLCSVETSPSHLETFQTWLQYQIEIAKSDGHIMKEIVQEALRQPSTERKSRIDTLRKDVPYQKADAVAELVLRVFDNFNNLINGAVEPLEILLPGDGLTKFYNVLEGLSDYGDFFSCLGHSNPGLRVLEIGAGTGGTTARILGSLISPNGTRLYSNYCYTDISSGFFPAAKERFKGFSHIQFATLDITRDPTTQGFVEGEFDIVVAANVLHATPSLKSTLIHVRKLLAPNGRLFLQELSPGMMKSINFIMGILPGWWLGGKDNRPLEPYASRSRWDEELRAVGFSGVDAAVFDDDEPFQLNMNIVSRCVSVVEESNSRKVPRIGIMTAEKRSHESIEIGNSFISAGYEVDYFTIEESVPNHQPIVSALEISTPFFQDISSEEFSKFQNFIANSQDRKILWLTKSSQLVSQDPSCSLVLGIARTLRSEASIDFTTLELDALGQQAWNSVVSLFQKITGTKTDSPSEIDPDYEFVLSDGVVQVGRYHAVKVPQEIPSTPQLRAPRKLKVGKLGLLQSLKWEQMDYFSSLGEDELEVEPVYVGLNFRDVLSSMGIIETSSGGLGLEASAVVRQVGSGVQGFIPGDRVIVFKSGCFSTRMRVSSMLCAKIPDEVSDEEAATVPTVYSTVIHSLMNLGGLKEGQTILIHSAAGGVGLAAIQICNMLGASVYVTAGNEEKVNFLHETFAIPRNHIFNSRDDSFLPDLIRETKGRGCDIVLNSLSGELLHASWKCVAAGGRFIELGKRDFIGHGKLAMSLFEDNRSFFGVDLNQFRPEQCQPLLQATVDLLAKKTIQPINPRKIFKASEIEDAFRYMQRGIHIGKVLVKMSDLDESNITTASKKIDLSPNKTYLLVGGLGGLGRAISTWMIERGARHFVYLSRSAGSEKDRPFIHELESQGVSVKTVAGSVSQREDVEYAISLAELPIGGVLQMSMVLRDTLFSEHTFEDWKTVVDPKVKGTWNLHNALLHHDLDFFVLFSSISGIVGTRGQAAYAAANTFLDAFVSYRHTLGLPASCMDIGMMTGIGYLAENMSLQNLLKSQDHYALQETDLIDALQLSIVSNKPYAIPSAVKCITNPSHLVIGLRTKKALSDSSNRALWKHDKRMSMFHNTSTEVVSNDGPSNDGLKDFISSVEADMSVLDAPESGKLLAHLIGTQIYIFMMHPIEELDVSQTLSALGVDSLVTIEIRNWWKRSLGVEVSTLEILGAGTIGGLAELAREGLKRKGHQG